MKTDCLAGIQQFLLEKGFKRRGYIFYRIMDDIAQLVSFDKASFIYCTCCMMPLYIPNDFIYYTLMAAGWRLVCVPKTAQTRR